MLRFETFERIKGLPYLGERVPLGVRIKSFSKCAAKTHANPGSRMRVVRIDLHDKHSGEADYAHQSKRRTDANSCDGPEIGHDFGNPSFPELPGDTVLIRRGLETPQNGPQRIHQIQECRGLMTDLVNEGGSDSAAHHPFAGDSNDGGRILATARKPRSGSADRGTVAAIQVANDWGRSVVTSGNRDCVCGCNIKSGEPYADFTLTALRHHGCKNIELREHSVESEAKKSEAALHLADRNPQRTACAKPLEKSIDHAS